MTQNDDYQSFDAPEDQTAQQAETGENQYEDPDFSPWEKKDAGSVVGQYIRHNGALFIGLGVAIAILFVLFKLLPKTPATVDNKRIMTLEGRVATLEDKLNQNGLQALDAEGMSGLPSNLLERVERLEAALETQTVALEEKIEGLEKFDAAILQRVANLKKSPPPSARVTVIRPETGKTETIETGGPMFHTVQDNDTLFRISKRYNIKIDALRRINGIGPEDTIHPGDRLKVVP